MHHGNIERDTAAGRLYRYLLDNANIWLDAYHLMMATRTIALSTRISEVRRQLPPGLAIEHPTTRRDGKTMQFYRLRKVA